jgi:hypothetical protein
MYLPGMEGRYAMQWLLALVYRKGYLFQLLGIIKWSWYFSIFIGAAYM